MSDTDEYYQYARSEMKPLMPKNYYYVLEIGCGEGNFRKNLTNTNEYWGVEPIHDVAERATKRLDRVIIGSYMDVYDQIPDDYFDLVICNDVIEHMVDHDLFLKSIKEKMKKQSFLVASIPNVRYVTNIYELIIKKIGSM